MLPGGRKPADVLLPWAGGLVGGDPSSDLCADLTITGLRDCYLARTVEDGSYPASQAHARKENLVGAACRNFGLTFVPVAMCALGSMTETTYNLISKISKKDKRQSNTVGRGYQQNSQQLFQEIEYSADEVQCQFAS